MARNTREYSKRGRKRLRGCGERESESGREETPCAARRDHNFKMDGVKYTKYLIQFEGKVVK